VHDVVPAEQEQAQGERACPGRRPSSCWRVGA
jgi:hypothetical protein